MNKSNYIDAVSQIKATESFRSKAARRMEAAASGIFPAGVKKRSRARGAIIAAAACAAVAAVILTVNILTGPEIKPFSPDLPMLTISEDYNGYGYEGLLAYKFEELRNSNPWTANASLSMLPVYQNTKAADPAGVPLEGLSAEEMLARAADIADKLGLAVETAYTEPTAEQIGKTEEKTGEKADDRPTRAVAECENVRIEVESSGTVYVRYETPVALPGQYNFTDSAQPEEAAAALEYLIAQYRGLLDMEEPAAGIFTDYNIYGERHVTYTVYDSAGDFTEKILGYHFNTASFYADENSGLSGFRLYYHDLSQKLGDYPIISAKRAQELLLDGSYISTILDTYPEKKNIAGVELVYRTGAFDAVYMPYYRFWVELTEMGLDNGLKDFGAYYVPAVYGEYLTNMPLWDGRFN